MKTIKGKVIWASSDGKSAMVETSVGKYDISQTARTLTDFQLPLRKGDDLTLTIEPESHNILLAIEKQGG